MVGFFVFIAGMSNLIKMTKLHKQLCWNEQMPLMADNNLFLGDFFFFISYFL